MNRRGRDTDADDDDDDDNQSYCPSGGGDSDGSEDEEEEEEEEEEERETADRDLEDVPPLVDEDVGQGGGLSRADMRKWKKKGVDADQSFLFTLGIYLVCVIGY